MNISGHYKGAWYADEEKTSGSINCIISTNGQIQGIVNDLANDAYGQINGYYTLEGEIKCVIQYPGNLSFIEGEINDLQTVKVTDFIECTVKHYLNGSVYDLMLIIQKIGDL